MLTALISALVSLFDLVSFNKTDISLDVIDESQETYTCIFRMTNKSEDYITISEVKTPCSCTTAIWTNGAIPPGKMGIIRVEYHTEHTIYGRFERTIQVYLEGHEDAATLKIRGYYEKEPEVNE